MKKTLVLFTLCMIAPAQSFAISYYKSNGGSIAKIDAAAFNGCSNVIYRSAAKDELDTDHKRNLVNAMLKGEAVNELSGAVAALKKSPGACSYGTDSEKFD